MFNKKSHKATTYLVLFAASLSLYIASSVGETNPTVQAETTDSTKAGSTEEIISSNVTRYEGYSRENVAENVARAQFSDSDKVILVNRDKFPDAISATNISQGKYPVLYTHAGNVSDSTLELLNEMSLDEIFVLGGTLSINDTVVNQLENETGVKVTRLEGRSRYDANVSAIRDNYSQKDHVVLASGEVYSDALYGVSYANTIDAPVVLTKTNNIEDSTVELLQDLGVKEVTIIGGPLTVSESVEGQLNQLGIGYNRISGRNRYISSAEVANAAYPDPENVVIASGEVFTDALVSAPLAQKLDAPILLVKSNDLEAEVSDYLNAKKVGLENVYIQGGPLTISQQNQESIKELTSYMVVTNVLPFESEKVEDENLLEGETSVQQEGKDGLEKVYYDVTYANGEEASREEFDRETVSEPVNEIISVGTRVDIESIKLSHSDITLTETESVALSAQILPENATNKSLIWSSSDDNVATVNVQGNVQGINAGEATITVTDSIGNITETVYVTVIEPTIETIENITNQVTQHDNYSLPSTVTALMSNGTTETFEVNWTDNNVDTSAIGDYTFEGTVEGVDQPIILTLEVVEYDPQLYTNAYSSVTINNLSKSLSMNIINSGTKPVNIEKIEIYEGGRIYTTYTPERLAESDIHSVIQPGENWGISITFRSGMFLDDSYVKYYVSANDTDYEFTSYLD